MIKLLISVLFLGASSCAFALSDPKAGQFDKRIKYVDYNPADIVKLVAHFGYQIDLVLQEGEAVLPKGVYLGDSLAWQFATLHNHVFIKPKEETGTTNMTIITNRRTYSLLLDSHWSENMKPNPDDMYFQVYFNYPQDEADKAAANRANQARLLAEAKAKAVLDDRMSKKEGAKNWNYWVQGSDSIAPDSAFDDGRFTHFTFKGNRDIPAIFIVNEDGSESLVNRHVEGDTVIVQSLSAKFVFRKGNAVACVFNKSFDAIGNDNSSGTTVPGVKRIIKGEAQ